MGCGNPFPELCLESGVADDSTVNPLVVCLLGVLGYAWNPTEENPFRKVLFLSYKQGPDPTHVKQPDAPQYGKGVNDIWFVLYYTFFFSFTREFIMQRILQPFAHHCGIFKKQKVARFMEQAYTAVYFGIFGPFGYYLLQAAYWLQQAIVLVLQLEKPRKDFKELILHHIVTVTLIFLSYRFHFTWIGLAVFWTHDVSDFFLAVSKTLNYIDHYLVAPWFALFIGMWIYMRHYLFFVVYWSVLTKFRTVGLWELDWDLQHYKCWIAQYIATVLLGALQAINLFWLFLIFRVAIRFVVSKEAVDERSEDEGEDDSSSSNQGEEKQDSVEYVSSLAMS
jgi:acyl-CoA-dependent ceramide synthase